MMKHLTPAYLILVCVGFANCSSPTIQTNEATPSAPESEARAHGLQAPPADPLAATSIPSDKAGSINGKRPPRYGIEPDSWQTCIGKTTAACSTGSGGIGAVCGIGTPCATPDFICSEGFCKRLGLLNEACLSNFECASPLACIASRCQQKSLLSGPCDEPNDCQLAAGDPGPAICVAQVCRVPGDVGAPCETNLHCKATSSSGVPLLCIIPSGQTVGSCNTVSGPGGPCTDESQCNQSTAPRCLPTVDLPRPTTSPRVCNLPAGEGGFCDDKPDCNQAVTGGRECINGRCRTKGAAGYSCNVNTDCNVGLACINRVCNTLSGTGGACDENADCTQTQAQRCISNVCRVTGLLNGPCGLNNFCSTNTQCVFAGNPGGAMVCVNDICKCPSSDTCQDNSQCPLTSSGEQQVCVPRLSPETGKRCRPAGTTPTGCCDEKADCRPLGASTCLLEPSRLGCNSGGVCVSGLPQGATCSRSDECSGVLVCRINTNIPFRNYTTCEYPL